MNPTLYSCKAKPYQSRLNPNHAMILPDMNVPTMSHCVLESPFGYAIEYPQDMHIKPKALSLLCPALSCRRKPGTPGFRMQMHSQTGAIASRHVHGTASPFGRYAEHPRCGVHTRTHSAVALFCLALAPMCYFCLPHRTPASALPSAHAHEHT